MKIIFNLAASLFFLLSLQSHAESTYTYQSIDGNINASFSFNNVQKVTNWSLTANYYGDWRDASFSSNDPLAKLRESDFIFNGNKIVSWTIFADKVGIDPIHGNFYAQQVTINNVDNRFLADSYFIQYADFSAPDPYHARYTFESPPLGSWRQNSPVPEPETYSMMLLGLGLMGFVARRRKSKQN